MIQPQFSQGDLTYFQQTFLIQVDPCFIAGGTYMEPNFLPSA
jgi:hypothetical protein